MNIKFITFGSHDNYIDAAKRLEMQAKSLNIFNQIILYTNNDLKKDDVFWKRNGDFINNNKRGHGYWLWKPYLIKKNMEQMNNGDILLYLDCGCEIDCNEKDYLQLCFNVVNNEKIISSNMYYLEKNWTKMDLFVKFNMNIDKYFNSEHREAGALMLLVCDETRNLVNEWYELGCDYHNIDDSPSIIPNLSCFNDHRHDQSIFSLLLKKYNIINKFPINNKCIKYIRNKSGKSFIIKR